MPAPACDPHRHLATFDWLDAMLEDTHAASPLAPANVEAVSQFLVRLRRAHFD